MKTVVFVSAGMLEPKKRDHALARRQLYLNYGALSLATTLKLQGYDAVLIHGEHSHPLDTLNGLRSAQQLPSQYPLMLSIPSFYALPWAQEFCRLVRAAFPDIRIVAGGRWVVDPDPSWIRTLLPEVDVFAPGLGEPYVESLLTKEPVLKRLAVATPTFTLDHRLVQDFMKYQPSVEASRGCGMGCRFCEERDMPLQPLGHPAMLINSLQEVQNQYGGGQVHPYLQSSMFLPSSRWAESLAEEANRVALKIKWRTETRVDAMTPSTLECLAEAGLSVIDLGLESASPSQIMAMKKSDNPDRYLRRAEKLLETCRATGVMAKVNVLLYAGETLTTFEETRAWLDQNSKGITGVSVGPVIAYGPPRTADILINDWTRCGARPVDSESAIKTGISRMHLSSDFDAQAAEEASLTLSRRYMNSDAYFALKSFSYYPRHYSRSDFEKDVGASDVSLLPFETGISLGACVV